MFLNFNIFDICLSDEWNILLNNENFKMLYDGLFISSEIIKYNHMDDTWPSMVSNIRKRSLSLINRFLIVEVTCNCIASLRKFVYDIVQKSHLQIDHVKIIIKGSCIKESILKSTYMQLNVPHIEFQFVPYVWNTN